MARYFKITLLLLASIFLCSCKRDIKNNLDSRDTYLDMCLKPITSGLIPIGEESWELNDFYKEEANENLPPSGWLLTAINPTDDFFGLDLLFFRKGLTGDELWFSHSNKEIKNIKIYYLSSGNFANVFDTNKGSHLVLDFSNSVWVYSPLENQETTGYGYKIEKFDEQNKSLDLITVPEMFLERSMFLKITPGMEPYLWMFSSEVTEGRQSHRLMLYNTQSEKLEFELPIESISYIVSDKENNLIYGNLESVTRMDWSSGKEMSHELSIGSKHIFESFLGGILITDSNLVILSDIEVFSNDRNMSQKKQFVRSPIFITGLKYNGFTPLDWQRPVIMTDTPDGRLWYRSSRGLTWFQPETGEWCMFTTAQSNIVKDGEGNLWIIYDNALYMLPAKMTKAKSK